MTQLMFILQVAVIYISKMPKGDLHYSKMFLFWVVYIVMYIIIEWTLNLPFLDVSFFWIHQSQSVILKQILSRMQSSGLSRCVALVRIDVSEERSTSIISVTRIGKLNLKILFKLWPCIYHFPVSIILFQEPDENNE
jgi:hypothetical protein